MNLTEDISKVDKYNYIFVIFGYNTMVHVSLPQCPMDVSAGRDASTAAGDKHHHVDHPNATDVTILSS